MSLTRSSHTLFILERFADSFPLSAHYRGGRKLRLAGWETAFPAMDRDVEEKERFLEAVDSLTAAGILSVKWKRFQEREELECLYLEDPERMFALLERPSPESLREKMISVICGRLDSVPERFRPVFEALDGKLEARHPIPVKTLSELTDLFLLFSVSRETSSRNTIRSLSIRLFRDSKRLEALLPLADRLLEQTIAERLSEYLGLERKFPEISIALSGAIEFPDGRRWDTDAEPLTLPEATVNGIGQIRIAVKPGRLRGGSPTCPAAEIHTVRVLSIENKESFHLEAARLALGESGHHAVLYSGGHPGPLMRRLFTLIASGNGPVEFHHSGDLDPDGLLIFQETAELCPGPLVPYRMTGALYEAYRRYGRPLAPELLARLHRVRHPEMLPLARLITEHRVGVEQEVWYGED